MKRSTKEEMEGTHELKPCLCGGKARLEDMGCPHHVYCMECGARVTSLKYGEEGEQEAADKWNKRADNKRQGVLT